MADDEKDKQPGGMPEDSKDKPGEMPGSKPKDQPAKPSGEIPDGSEDMSPDAQLERMRDALKKANREAADHRKKAEAYEAEKKAAEEKALADQGKFKELAEKREKELEGLKAQITQNTLRSAVLLEAAKAGIADPEDAVKLADLSKVKVEESGVSGVTEAVAALIAAKPYLVKPTSSAPDAPPPPPKVGATNPGGGPQMTADDLKKMTMQEIAAMGQDAIAAILARK